ncbi:APC family permease [Maridesulfovibrio zosterae]|uniref:APC family permease n=1 Tax=Maridesulfovibrio zosterae TaxID=82171 RepID=UPI00040AC2EA|nr:amino acid permease [Maridesulfovibrio zosterae]
MKKKVIGTLQLSGLIVGAVLGSGIILLPPIAHMQLHDWSITAWTFIMSLGAVFAILFAKLALAFPGDEGVAIAVREAFGIRAGQLVSNYIICAVCVGPVAVLMTAAKTISTTFSIPANFNPAIAGGLLILCMILLMRSITTVGTIAFASSLAIAFVLAAGSINTIITMPVYLLPVTEINIQDMGRTLLIMFWAIIGWEVIGNYTLEVRAPQKTIPMATAIGTGTICIIYILVAVAIQSIHSSAGSINNFSMYMIVTSLLGKYSKILIMLISTALCICTYLMFVGAIARLLATLASKEKLPVVLSKRNVNDAPTGSLYLLFTFHFSNLLLLHFGLITLEQVISFANVFFLANSLIAVSAAIKIFPSLFLRIPSILLCAGFLSLLSFSSIWPLLALLAVTIGTLRFKTLVVFQN